MAINRTVFIVFACIGILASVVFAHPDAGTNIDTQSVGEKWGWNDIMGWINMHDSHTVMVSGTKITGSGTSSFGDIIMSGVTNGGEAYGVANDGGGNLSGWVWNDTVGWISIAGTTADAQNYSLRVAPMGDAVNSYFRGWAWNDIVGWINLNCLETSSCGSNNYKTQTGAGSKSAGGVFISNIFDIGTTTGIFNTIMWKGSQPGGTKVQFEIATVNTPTASWDTLYGSIIEIAKDTPYLLNIENQRYIRYRITLVSDTWQSASPRIDDILINWSP